MKTHLKYFMQGAPIEHPQIVMQKLGIKYQHSTVQSYADQWWFWNCENIPSPLPDYLEELKKDPMQLIGILTEQEAKYIKNGL
jgi:hypothetical protein